MWFELRGGLVAYALVGGLGSVLFVGVVAWFVASPKLRNLKIILLLVSIDSKRVKLLIFKTKKTEKPQP